MCPAGMVLGNAISGISVGLSTVVEELSSGVSSCAELTAAAAYTLLQPGSRQLVGRGVWQ